MNVKKKKALYVEELLEEAHRKDKDPQTHEQLLERARRIRDSAQIWMELCVAMMDPKGSGTAQLLYEKNRQEVETLEKYAEMHSQNLAWIWADEDEAEEEVCTN
jgi:hypothetical protein